MLIAINDQPKGIAGRMLNFIGDFFFKIKLAFLIDIKLQFNEIIELLAHLYLCLISSFLFALI